MNNLIFTILSEVTPVFCDVSIDFKVFHSLCSTASLV